MPSDKCNSITAKVTQIFLRGSFWVTVRPMHSSLTYQHSPNVVFHLSLLKAKGVDLVVHVMASFV